MKSKHLPAKSSQGRAQKPAVVLGKSGRGGRRPGAGRPKEPESEAGLRRQKLALEVRRLRVAVEVDERTKVDLELVCQAIAQRTAACRSRLLALPPKVAPLVATLDDPEQVRQLLADAVEEALAEMATDARALVS